MPVIEAMLDMKVVVLDKSRKPTCAQRGLIDVEDFYNEHFRTEAECRGDSIRFIYDEVAEHILRIEGIEPGMFNHLTMTSVINDPKFCTHIDANEFTIAKNFVALMAEKGTILTTYDFRKALTWADSDFNHKNPNQIIDLNLAQEGFDTFYMYKNGLLYYYSRTLVSDFLSLDEVRASSPTVVNESSSSKTPASSAVRQPPEKQMVLEAAVRFSEYITNRWPQVEGDGRLEYFIAGSLAVLLLAQADSFVEM